jgi:hypothetical protein
MDGSSTNSLQQPLTKLEWDTAQLTTPLNHMPVGDSSRWTISSDKTQVVLPTKYSASPTEMKPVSNEHTRSLAVLPSAPAVIDKLKPGYPTARMIEMGKFFQWIAPTKLKHSDFASSQTLEALLALVATFMEHRLVEHLSSRSPVYIFNVAHSLLTAAPGSLITYFRTRSSLDDLLREVESIPDRLPPLDKDSIHPAMFTRLIRDPSLIARRWEVDLSHQECMGIASPFIRRFYPLSSPRAIHALRSLPVAELVDIVQKPGYFAKLWRGTEQQCVFDPPRWVELNLHAPREDTQLVVESAAPLSSPMLDGLSPLTMLGLPINEASALPSESLRTRSIQLLPQALSHLLPPDEMAQWVIMLATAP